MALGFKRPLVDTDRALIGAADATLTREITGNMTGKPTTERLLAMIYVELRALRADVAALTEARATGSIQDT